MFGSKNKNTSVSSHFTMTWKQFQLLASFAALWISMAPTIILIFFPGCSHSALFVLLPLNWSQRWLKKSLSYTAVWSQSRFGRVEPFTGNNESNAALLYMICVVRNDLQSNDMKDEKN